MSYKSLSLAEATTIVEKSLAHGRERSLNPLSVAVLDAGGHLLAFAREDGSSNLRPQIAMAKASGALALDMSSRRIGEMALERPTFVSAVSDLSSCGVVPAAGGVLIRDGDGQLMGAVGITGDTSDNDEACAIYAVEFAGLKSA